MILQKKKINYLLHLIKKLHSKNSEKIKLSVEIEFNMFQKLNENLVFF